MVRKSAIELLERASALYGSNIGYEDYSSKITFGELRETAGTIGTNLLAAMPKTPLHSIKPIIVLMPKSVKCIISYMGILYSGNPYVPLDANIPAARLQKIINNLNPEGIITEAEYAKVLEQVDVKGAKVYYYCEISEGQPNEDLIQQTISKVVDTDPIYIMYTSGSTGEPKGVTIPHRGVLDYADWVVNTFSLTEQTIMANQAPFYFDNSVFEIYGALLSGGKMVLIPEQLMLFPVKLPEFLIENKINTIFWVPTVLINVANSGILETVQLEELKVVAFCGEIMPNKQLNMWRKSNPHCLYANLYGPTEITDVCSYYIVDKEFEDWEPLPIGKACENMRILILNGNDEAAEPGETGELCVIGSGLALGYWGNKEQTDKVFVQNPINTNYNENMYRTGDLGYINEDGLIMIQGRMDSQIKHRGNRIELGEIEKAASCIEGVRRSCALFDSEQEQIVLYLETDLKMNSRKVNVELSKLVPKYMLPQTLKVFEKFPMTPNDKIDRKQLQALNK